MNAKLLFAMGTAMLACTAASLSAQTATSTTLTVSPNPVIFGAAVTLKATVTPNTATGKVTFYDGVKVLGEGPVSGGVSQISTLFLLSGVRPITARYNGAAGVTNASNSAPVYVTVTPQFAGTLTSLSQMSAGTNPSSIAAADFNGDGRADLAVTNELSGTMSVFLGNGDGTFQSAVTYSASRPTSVVTGDFNGDGRQDLAVVESSAFGVQVFLGNGDGTFTVGSFSAVGTSPLGIVAADFNADGATDLATSDLGNNTISLLLGNGDGSFRAATITSVTGYLEGLTVGDFNGDGKPDIALAVYDENAVDVFLGNGDGTFQPYLSYGAGQNPVAVTAIDFNNDGHTDLAVANSGSQNGVSSVSVLLGNGNGTFQPATSITGFSGAQSIVTGDFNGDGKRDLAVGNSTADSVSILAGTGTGTFYPPVSFSAGSVPQGLVIADFNGDGKTDIAIADFNSPNGAPNVNILGGGAASVSIVQGNSQTTPAGSAFPVPLEVTVTGFGAPAVGVPVTFTAPSTGASAAFAGAGQIATVNTDANGQATAPALTANGITGAYTVTASAGGGSVAFSLTNNSSGCTFSFSPASITVDANGGSTNVTVTPSSPTCSYGITPNVSWITATPSTAVGSATVAVSVSTFVGGTADRTGAVVIGSQSLLVTQAFTQQIFADVPPTAYYFDSVNLLKTDGITSGCSATDYCPAQNVTRDQMAIFIVRAVYHGSDDFTYSATPYFTDVTPTTFGFKWIQKLYELGITTGCGANLYCPTSPVARDQMAVFIIRARYGATTTFTYSSTPFFTDVPTTEFAFNWIQRMKEDNITSGCGANIYCPSGTVTRGDMSVFIVRGGFNQLLPATMPVISSVNPTTLAPGSSGTYTVTGTNTHFVAGVTTVVSSASFTASNVTVLSPTQLTVTLTAATGAPLQPASIYVQTEPEEAVLPNGLLVAAP